MSGVASQRYSMAFYPAIAVLLAQLIRTIARRFGGSYVFRLFFLTLSVYLVFLCIVPRASTNLITFKYKDFESQIYPMEKAVDWVRSATTDEKILFLSMPRYFKFYIERIYPYRDKMSHERFVYYFHSSVKGLIYPLQNLKKFCYAENVTYIMFPFGPNNIAPDVGASDEVKYLEEIRDDAFKEVARFNYEDNFIVVYKLKRGD